MKRTSLLAVLLLLLVLVAGCGGSDSSGSADAGDDADSSAGGPPTDASVEDFCGTFLDLIEQASQQGSDVSDADAVELAKEAADKLSEVGTPEDMPADARRAFEKAIELIRSIPEGATQKEMDDIAADLTAEQQQDLQALTAYVTEKCMGQLAPSDVPEQWGPRVGQWVEQRVGQRFVGQLTGNRLATDWQPTGRRAATSAAATAAGRPAACRRSGRWGSTAARSRRTTPRARCRRRRGTSRRCGRGRRGWTSSRP